MDGRFHDYVQKCGHIKFCNENTKTKGRHVLKHDSLGKVPPSKLVLAYILSCMGACAHLCGGQRITSGIIPQATFTFD